MPDSYTAKLNLTKPEVGASTDTWGTKINSDLDSIDGLFDTGPYLKLAKGGTGAGTAADARTNLGLGALATKALITSSDITDGTIITGDLASSVTEQFVPAGLMAPYPGATAPTGWLLCFGQAVSRTTYSALFAILSTTYGSGDGSTTFNLPDLRGRVIAGQDDMGGTSANRLTGLTGGVDGDVLGGTGGAESHTLTEAQMPAHKHGSGVLHKTSIDAGVYGMTTTDVPGEASQAHDSGFGSTSNSSHPWTQTVGSGSAHNNVQPTIILNYIIKT